MVTKLLLEAKSGPGQRRLKNAGGGALMTHDVAAAAELLLLLLAGLRVCARAFSVSTTHPMAGFDSFES